ncbi:hypothetical protein MRB53_001993 [Persea americana]|uniref:Uncharacterized protein n=1 Tax=Persea americana TaxID=3435 RepID=A0ACC2MTB1_PERAE|nr:hypothetical protein MRB53_001993 [Persea americana]
MVQMQTHRLNMVKIALEISLGLLGCSWMPPSYKARAQIKPSLICAASNQLRLSSLNCCQIQLRHLLSAARPICKPIFGTRQRSRKFREVSINTKKERKCRTPTEPRHGEGELIHQHSTPVSKRDMKSGIRESGNYGCKHANLMRKCLNDIVQANLPTLHQHENTTTAPRSSIGH